MGRRCRRRSMHFYSFSIWEYVESGFPDLQPWRVTEFQWDICPAHDGLVSRLVSTLSGHEQPLLISLRKRSNRTRLCSVRIMREA